jgi:hypothetical protein
MYIYVPCNAVFAIYALIMRVFEGKMSENIFEILEGLHEPGVNPTTSEFATTTPQL